MRIFKKYFIYFAIVFISLLAFLPILNKGFFPMHDDTQPTRVYEMAQALKDGMFPVRWSMDLGFGYGYPIFNFYAPLAYYTGAIFNLIGFSALDATKIMMILGIIFSAVSMYLFAKELFGKWAGLFSAALYIYAPYHAVNIFVRGDVGEFYAYGLFPFIFWGLYKIYKEKKQRYMFLTSISFALLIISHNLSAFIISPFLVFFALLLGFKNKSLLLKLFFALFLGVLFSAFYTLPALFEMNYTNVISQVGGGADFRDHFVCLSQLWASPWGYGGSAKGCIDGLSFMIGKYHILASLVSLIAVITYGARLKLQDQDRKRLYIVLMFTGFALVSVFLMLDYSRILWELIPALSFLQYPWRFLIVTVFSLSIVSGALIWILEKYIKRPIFPVLSIFLIIAVILLNSKFFTAQKIIAKSSNDYVQREKIAWDISKISSEYMPKNFQKPKLPSQTANFHSVENSNVRLIQYTQKTNSIVLTLYALEKNQIVVPIAYFPAWKASINGKDVAVFENKKGISVDIPKGPIKLVLSFRQTPIELLGDYLSLAGIFILAIGIIKARKNDQI